MILSYETIFSRVRNECDDPKELSLNENDLNEIYTERLRSVVGEVNVRRLFSILKLDDEIQQMTWELSNTIDKNDQSLDEEFVIEIFVLGMTINWLKPIVNSKVATSIMIGGKEEKLIKNMHKTNIERLESLERKLSRRIVDHEFSYNSYLGN